MSHLKMLYVLKETASVLSAQIYMSKINQIQNELRQLSGEAFQKLADAYLHKRGYEQINPLGSVIGADKVRTGTPDTLVPLPNGKYVFAEYTTTESDKIIQKFQKDLKKCFDEAKTQILVNKIQEIVFCHTSMLEPDQERDLREECQKRGVNLNIFGVGPISFDLYQKYPGIARDRQNWKLNLILVCRQVLFSAR